MEQTSTFQRVECDVIGCGKGVLKKSGRVPGGGVTVTGSHVARHRIDLGRNDNKPQQTGDSKERTFESPFVITVRQPRIKAKAGAPQSKKASSSAPTANTRKRKPAKTSRNGKTTTSQASNPKDTVFELEAQVPGQVKKSQ